MAGRCLIRWGLSCRLVMAAGNLARVAACRALAHQIVVCRYDGRIWHIRLWCVDSSPDLAHQIVVCRYDGRIWHIRSWCVGTGQGCAMGRPVERWRIRLRLSCRVIMVRPVERWRIRLGQVSKELALIFLSCSV